MNKRISISEIYGPCLQGEGPVAGRATIFVRTFGCDSYCTVCDSMYAVDPKAPGATYEMLEPGEIAKRIQAISRTQPVTFTGGNPALWDMNPVLDMLGDQPAWIETQGTYWRDWIARCAGVVVSPKGPFMDDIRKRPTVLHEFYAYVKPGRLYLKIVVGGIADLDYAEHVASLYPQIPMHLSVGTPPGASTADVLMRYRWLQTLVLSNAWPRLQQATFLPQLHVLTYGHQRGI